MALLRSNSEIVERAKINLYFEDETEKHVEVGENDIIRVRFNDAGYARELVGKVTKISRNLGVTPPPPPFNYPPCGGTIPMAPPMGDDGFMLVDGSDVYKGVKAKIRFKDILDIDMVEKYDEDFIVKTTTENAANRIRVVDGVFQIYVNGNFVNVDELMSEEAKTALSKAAKIKEAENVPTTPSTINPSMTTSSIINE